MEDDEIIDLYFARSEDAVRETQRKYGRMLRTIAFRILNSHPDAEECEEDTYVRTWNAVPPERPMVFSAFLSRITRNLSLNRYEEMHAEKRGKGEMPVILDEMAECIPDEKTYQDTDLREILDDFLRDLDREERNIFLRRYWYGDPLRTIAHRSGFSQGKVKMMLLRTRKKLKEVLKQEGYAA